MTEGNLMNQPTCNAQRARLGATVMLTFGSIMAVAPDGSAATKPTLGRSCKVSQIGTVSGTLVCTKSGKAATWRRSPAPTNTVFDIVKTPAGTIVYRENFDDPAKSTWSKQSGEGWSGEIKDGQFRLAAAPPAPGRLTVGPLLAAAGRVEVAFDMTTPALGGVGDGFTLYVSTFSTGFRDAAELLIDNVAITKV